MGESRTRIKIDITKEANEKILLPLSVGEIIHPYSDMLKAEIGVHALEDEDVFSAVIRVVETMCVDNPPPKTKTQSTEK